MKGLELAEAYFETYGRPLIDGEYRDYRGRIAAGLVGDGSECLGFDDDWSRDHDWGPGFCIWLGPEDYGSIGTRLQDSYERLPGSFKGFERMTSEWGVGRVGVFEIESFYRRFLGRRGLPVSLSDWLRIPESNLAACTSGKVFCDPLGEFSRARDRLLGFYPDDVRAVKIGARCMAAGQAGQYNFIRSVRRQEHFAARCAEAKFCTAVIRIAHLVNRRYSPYYKWALRSLLDLERLGACIYQKISRIAISTDPEEKHAFMEEISAAVIGELQREDLTDSDSPWLVDHGPAVHDKAVDSGLRKLDVWVG